MSACFSEFLGDSIFEQPDPIGTGRPQVPQPQVQQHQPGGANAFGLQNLAQSLVQYRAPDNAATMHQADSSLSLVPQNPQAANMQVSQGIIHAHHQPQNRPQAQAMALQSQQSIVPGQNMMMMITQG